MRNLRTTRRVLRHVAFFFANVFVITSSLSAWSNDVPLTDLWSFRGPTMGTTYMVKISGAPGGEVWREETSFAIETELRRVNDQMSTYLKTSELSRFNDSSGTDWFPVSRPTAEVVLLALDIGERSGGRLDVTVGPLVDRWSFGPAKRSQTVPQTDEIESIRERVGNQFLAARIDPPAIKKSIPGLRVDLSAIAKGHGVDRLVELLNKRGAKNVFVEIGGEVRVSGAKQTPAGPVAWKVGIQKPDADANELALAHPMQDNAMATSGDYRNYFEVDGKRYSHTIDPTTGRPIEHTLASVTVIAPTCARADGWATALNVAGPQAALQLANENGLDTLLIQRVNQSNQGKSEMISFEIIGTGGLAEVAQRMNQAIIVAQSAASDEAGFGERMMPILILTAVGFGIVLIAMAIGVIFGRKSISGSCGGLNARTDPDGVSRCSMCSSPSEGCQELRNKIEQGNA